MIMKGANGEAHFGNISVLPSKKRWVFNEIFKTVFIELYGESTIRCNHLMLMDEDSAEVEPVMNSIAMIDAYHGCTYALYVPCFGKEVQRVGISQVAS